MSRVLVCAVGHSRFVNDVRVCMVPLRAFTNATRTLDDSRHDSRNGARDFPGVTGDLTAAARGSAGVDRALVLGAHDLVLELRIPVLRARGLAKGDRDMLALARAILCDQPCVTIERSQP